MSILCLDKIFLGCISQTEYQSLKTKNQPHTPNIPFIKWGYWCGFILSTVDVAGGYSASMLDAIRRAVMVSNILLINKINEKSLTLKEVFRLATLGGSQGNDHFVSFLNSVRPRPSVSSGAVWRLWRAASAGIPYSYPSVGSHIPPPKFSG